jgi:hypothetical protein
MTDKGKKNITVQKSESDKSVKIEERNELKQLLIQLAEEKVESKFSDPQLDRENEKIRLLNGTEISLKEIRLNQSFISNTLSEYMVTFPSEFYRQINRLHGWNISETRLHKKPPIVGRYTKEIIYGRFHKDVINILQSLNPYIGFGVRPHKHFQWLTPEGKKRLEEYLKQSIELMKNCSNWYEFRVKYFEKYGVPYQADCFKDNSGKSIHM